MAVINRFVDGESVRVFEISPSGQMATLILMTKDEITAQVLKSESTSLFKDQIIRCESVFNFHEDILPAYLSQNKQTVGKSLLVLETDSVSGAMLEADAYLKKGIKILDFRTVRTSPKNIILIFTGDNFAVSYEQQLSNFKINIIENVEPTLKQYFEIST